MYRELWRGRRFQHRQDEASILIEAVSRLVISRLENHVEHCRDFYDDCPCHECKGYRAAQLRLWFTGDFRGYHDDVEAAKRRRLRMDRRNMRERVKRALTKKKNYEADKD